MRQGSATSLDTNAAHARHAAERIFFSSLAVLLALLVFVAFGPTYYWTPFGEGVTHTALGVRFTGIFHVHGAVFTAWVVLFLGQALLIANRRVALHRRLGYAAAVVAAAMVILGLLVAIETARAGIAPAGGDPVSFMIVPVGDMVLFGGFVAAGILLRRNTDAHKRLMVGAYACLLVATLSRITAVSAMGPAAPVLGSFLPIAAGMVFDLRVHGRVHRAYLWGFAVLLASGVRVPIGESAAWRSFASWLLT
ncbi:MAG: hypothetical protein IT361_10535 [Gemmatimonadaceae bacterium]|nr:hypothetical protein [Gemmatimonadaceae bacterium]